MDRLTTRANLQLSLNFLQFFVKLSLIAKIYVALIVAFHSDLHISFEDVV